MDAMRDAAVTTILLAIGVGVIWIGYWAVIHRKGDARGGNASADPNSLSADPAEVLVKTRGS